MPSTAVLNLTEPQAKVVARLAMKMSELNITARFVPPVAEGPMISAFRFLPQGSTRVSHLEQLADDFAVALGTDEPVLVKRMPGESAVGIFIPRSLDERRPVPWSTLDNWYAQLHHGQHGAPLIPLLLGVDWLGFPFLDDLSALPHLLVSGSTNSGKSTLLNALITTIIKNLSPNAVRLALSDTKQVEFTHLEGAPHLLCKTATSIYQTMEMMENLTEEMERRLEMIGRCGDRNIFEYNVNASGHSSDRMPYIVFVIDELFDLMTFKGEKRGESKLSQQKLALLASKARATGIHIIASTQRPSVDVVAGVIKANFPARLSFRLPSGHDSRTVLGTEGAEHLIAKGDMLFVSPNRSGLQRLHAPLATLEDIKNAVSEAKTRNGAKNQCE